MPYPTDFYIPVPIDPLIFHGRYRTYAIRELIAWLGVRYWADQPKPRGTIVYFSQTIRYIMKVGTYVMGKPNVKSNPKKPTGDFTWVNLRVPDALHNDADDFEPTPDEIVKHLFDLAHNGYNITIKVTPNGSFMACLIGQVECSDNANRGMSAYADTAHGAVIGILFKHFVVAAGGAWEGGTGDKKRRFS